MNLHIGITTAPRRQLYLETVLASLPPWAVVWIAPTVPADLPHCRIPAGLSGGVLDPLLAFDQEEAPRCVEGCLERNTDRLIRHVAAQDGAGVFVTLQDDVRPCPRAWDRVAQLAEWLLRHPETAWISFYTPWVQAQRARTALWPYPARTFYGDLALLWNRAAALEFVPNSSPSVAHDLSIQQYFGDKQWKTYGHNPCLFQHIGVESATGKSWHSGQRTTMNFSANRDAIRHAKRLPP